MSASEEFIEPHPRLERTRIAKGEARVAVFKRGYNAPIEDVWDACTNPERLSRWYAPVRGDLQVGGTFEQPPMGAGRIVTCAAPHHLKLSLADGKDEIELHLLAQDDGTTALELRHATTLDSHEIGGQMFDAIFCMGGGYYPRLHALDQHLRGTLSADYDPFAFHQDPQMRPIIDRGSQAMATLLEEGGESRR